MSNDETTPPNSISAVVLPLLIGGVAFVAAIGLLPNLMQTLTPPPNKVKIWVAATEIKAGEPLADIAKQAIELEVPPKDVQDTHIRISADLDGKQVIRTLRPGDPIHRNDLIEIPKPIVVPAGMVKRTFIVPPKHATTLLSSKTADLIRIEKVHSKYHGQVLVGSMSVLKVEVVDKGEKVTVAVRERDVATIDENAKKPDWRLIPAGTSLQYTEDINKIEELRRSAPKEPTPAPEAPAAPPAPI